MCDQGLGFSLTHTVLAVAPSVVPPMAVLRAPGTCTGGSEVLWLGPRGPGSQEASSQGPGGGQQGGLPGGSATGIVIRR